MTVVLNNRQWDINTAFTSTGSVPDQNHLYLPLSVWLSRGKRWKRTVRHVRMLLWIVVDEVDEECLMIRLGVSGWMFLLVPAHPDSPGQRAVKCLCVFVCLCVCVSLSLKQVQRNFQQTDSCKQSVYECVCICPHIGFLFPVVDACRRSGCEPGNGWHGCHLWQWLEPTERHTGPGPCSSHRTEEPGSYY